MTRFFCCFSWSFRDLSSGRTRRGWTAQGSPQENKKHASWGPQVSKTQLDGMTFAEGPCTGFPPQKKRTHPKITPALEQGPQISFQSLFPDWCGADGLEVGVPFTHRQEPWAANPHPSHQSKPTLRPTRLNGSANKNQPWAQIKKLWGSIFAQGPCKG